MSLEVSADLILTAALWPPESAQPITETSTRDVPRSIGQPTCKELRVYVGYVDKWWEPGCLTTLWAPMASFMDRFISHTHMCVCEFIS
jgi:hypothetical protein